VSHRDRRDTGLETALARLRRELAAHDESGAPETPFSAGIRQVLEDEDARREHSAGGSAA
jgi:hypothetical protein